MIPTRPSGVKHLTDNFEKSSANRNVRKQDSILKKLDGEHLVKDKKKIFENVIENGGSTKISSKLCADINRTWNNWKTLNFRYVVVIK